VAKQKAVPVIAACKRFQAEHNHYPSNLSELADAAPLATFGTLHACQEKVCICADPPELCFAAMFHGVFYYDLQTGKWLANE
jgi:hypothetical protein